MDYKCTIRSVVRCSRTDSLLIFLTSGTAKELTSSTSEDVTGNTYISIDELPFSWLLCTGKRHDKRRSTI